jgi:branched-chain amino acid transport system permease protein
MAKTTYLNTLLQFSPGLILLAALLLLPIVADPFTIVNSTYWLICGLLALSLSFVWGIGGIFSFGQTIFFGLAGYTYGVVSLNIQGIGGTILALCVGVIIAVLAATIIGYFMFYGRVASLYVAIITLATTLIFYNLFISTSGGQYQIGEAALGGFNGMQRVPTLLDLDITSSYWLVITISSLTLILLLLLRRSRFGRVFNAVRANEERTELLGYDVRGVKLTGFVIGGAIAALAGVLHTSWGNTINPTVFNLDQATLVAIWVMVGGRTKLWGAFLGAALIQSFSNFLGTTAQYATPLILGATLIALVLFLPEGIAPAIEKLWQQVFPINCQVDLPLSTPISLVDTPLEINKSYEILIAKNLKRKFGNFWAVDGVDLEFKTGQPYCIIGPNGAGKSTFFNLLTGRLRSTGGQVIYDGEDVTALMPFERARRGISIKLQVPNIYHELSVYENLWLAAAIRYPNLVEKHAKMAQIVDEIGLRDRLNTRAGELSHGEKQWLEIGMAAVTDPRLILLDEPTGGMSRGETLKTVELVNKLANNSTVIVVEHDMEFVRQLGAFTTVFAQGKVLATGTIENIQQDERVIEVYLGKAHV